jgi:hypothetical protein
MAVDHDGRLWISYARAGQTIREPVYSLDHGEWTTNYLPEIHPVPAYYVRSIAFDGRGDGWAISDTWDGEAWSQGILLRFRDGRWRLQNWTWPFWRQRWFGLFG